MTPKCRYPIWAHMKLENISYILEGFILVMLKLK